MHTGKSVHSPASCELEGPCVRALSVQAMCLHVSYASVQDCIGQKGSRHAGFKREPRLTPQAEWCLATWLT